MQEKILRLLEQNGDISNDQLAVMLNTDVKEIDAAVEQMKKDGVLLRNKALINWEKTDREVVTAIIELRVTPQRGEGFDKIAERIYQYPEVTSLYLMSGGFDLEVIIEGKTMKEVALFVAEKLAPMEHVLSTATHFLLKKYKDAGVIFESKRVDERSVITL